MMSELIFSLILILNIILWKANNPIKASIILLILSSLGFLVLNLNSSGTWIPLIIFILFTGGILMIFIILASVSPNENTLKTNLPNIWIILAIILPLIESFNVVTSNENLLGINSILTSSNFIFFIISLILIYFLCSIGINNEQESPIRSQSCHNSDNFVNSLNKWQ